MANVYYTEGSYESAYVLYMKYMTLFIEKIRKHPAFKDVPLTTKEINKQQLREIIPKAEKLKKELLDQYTKEYLLYKSIKEKEDEEERRATEEEEERSRSRSTSKTKSTQGQSTWIGTSLVLPPTDIDNINYPDPNIAVNEFRPSIPDKSSKPTFPTSSTVLQPIVDRSSKPSSISSQTAVSGLRSVVVPTCVMPRFLLLAKNNTLANKETCGILAGTLEMNQLIITHVIIPKQKGTSDSCLMMNEEETFDYQDQHNLITIGWIHTHPTQTAFLSSVDLHTHCPYQLLMPEAIAIVCAPKYNDTGIFVLTPDYGLDYILNCRLSGFHPHPTDPPLFMAAEHIKMNGSAPLEVLDLRDKK
ncbi:PREDICTED: STAM-binding protein isoform X2 [Nicrophorus vespilloides]|nr:PREDICTED: STAM-binding protein isoform X2 [Nicrophorus vespilloides]